MEWNVFYHDVNSGMIKPFNIFRHSGFAKDLQSAVKYSTDKERFSEALSQILKYYFWSKCEYEILMCPWPYHPERDNPVKIDVFRQIELNWSAFVDYVWINRKLA